MTLEEELIEKKNRLERLQKALELIPPGVSSYSVDGESFTYDRQSLLREIRALEHDIQALQHRGHSRLTSFDISGFYTLFFLFILLGVYQWLTR